MRHQKTSDFPDDVETSEKFRKLVCDLLQGTSQRLNHEKLVKHPFFSTIDWSRLRDSVPPFVPVVNSEDDTSNFVEFDHEPPTPSIENFKTRKEFSGKDLPFIGFTYTHDVSQSQPLASGYSVGEKDKMAESLLAAKKKEIEDLYRKLQEAQSTEKVSDMKIIERKLEECSQRLRAVQEDRSQLELALEKSKNEAQSLKRALTLEREDRKMLETNAITMIRDSKARWEKKRQQEQLQLQNCIKEKEQEITQLSSQREALEIKLKQMDDKLKQSEQKVEDLQLVLDANKNKVSEVREKTRMSIVGVETHLQKIVSDKQKQVITLQENLESEMKHVRILEEKIKELETVVEKEKLEHSSECDQFRKENKKLQLELSLQIEKYATLQKKVREEKMNVTLAENSRVIELESSLSEERLNSKRLMEKMEAMKKEMLALKSEQEKHASVQTEKIEEHLCVIATIENELKVSKRQQMDLKCSLEQKNNELLNIENEKKIAEDKLIDTQKLILQLQKENLSLNNQILSAKEEDDKLVSQGNGTTEKINELVQKQAFLEDQIEKLEGQLEKTREALVLEKDNSRNLQTQLWKKDKELSDTKIDLRISEREVKTTKKELESLQEEKVKWDEKVTEEKTAHEKEMRNHWEKIEALHQEQKMLRAELEEKQQQIFDLTQKLEAEKSCLAEETRKQQECSTKLKSAQENITNNKQLIKSLETQVTSLLSEVDNLKKLSERSREDKEKLMKELEEQKNRCHSLDMNISVLKETCSMLEEQLEDYEKVSTIYEEKDKKNASEISELQDQIEKLQQDVRISRQEMNQEKSFKIIAETKLQQIESEVASQNEFIATLQDQLQDYKKLAETLTEQVAELESTCGDQELSIRNTNRQLEIHQLEKTDLKEEISQHLTTIHDLRESVFKLSRELEDKTEHSRNLEQRLLYLQAEMDEQRVFHQHREIKSDATIQQQIKLIDFLQRSLSEHSKKKKTLTDKIFGRQKENVAPRAGPISANRDLQFQLAQERGKVKLLTEQLEEAKAQLNKKPFSYDNTREPLTVPTSPNSRLALSQIVQSPGTQQRKNFERQPSMQRMHHNIPHRFEPKLSMRVNKCAVCLDSIHFGRYAAVCQECCITAHPKCSLAMPKTCGLPSGFIKHFSKTFNSNETSSNDAPPGSSSVEGYVKLPKHGNSGWERHYLRLRGTMLEVFSNQPVSNDEAPDSTFDLCPTDGAPRVLSAVPCSDVEGTASSDMPFILKVEIVPRTTCWPKSKTFLIMTLSFPDKQKWVQALEEVVQQSCGLLLGSERYRGLCLMSLEKSHNSATLDINCSVELSDQILLLGAEEGLHSLRMNKKEAYSPPVKIHGPTQVHQIVTLRVLGLAIMIAEESRALVQCDFNQLKSAAEAAECSHPSISTHPVIPQSVAPTYCHLFAASPTNKPGGDIILCVATSDKLILLKWISEQSSFIPVKLLDTTDPCSCIHFTPHSIIVGCNKFFELDLKNFFVEEFLDTSDPSLAPALIGAQQLNSFPVSILDVTDKESPPEFLLCFNEFGVFVDQYGRQTRQDDLKWSHLPLAFAYRRPFIFIVHFTSVEIMKLTSTSFAHEKDDTSSTANYPDQTFIELDNPRYLGTSSKMGTIYISTSSSSKCVKVTRLDANVACKGDMSFSLTDSDGADINSCGSVEFSFTSSLVQSLDDGLDTETNSNGEENEQLTIRQHVRFNVPRTAL